jgi:hypothetical protein
MASRESQLLISLFESLPITDQSSLLSFAEFLVQRSPDNKLVTTAPILSEPEPVPEPKLLPRPENERVVAAVKRLSKSYFMLDKRKILSLTSDLMTQHILQGKEAEVVIDELEAVFSEFYRQLVEGED